VRPLTAASSSGLNVSPAGADVSHLAGFTRRRARGRPRAARARPGTAEVRLRCTMTGTTPPNDSDQVDPAEADPGPSDAEWHREPSTSVVPPNRRARRAHRRARPPRRANDGSTATPVSTSSEEPAPMSMDRGRMRWHADSRCQRLCSSCPTRLCGSAEPADEPAGSGIYRAVFDAAD